MSRVLAPLTALFALALIATPGLAQPGININNVTVTEGNSGQVNAVFQVTLTVASPTPVAITYTTEAATATGGVACGAVDFLAATGTLTIPAGSVSQPITVKVCGDTSDEPNETFRVKLSNAKGGTIQDSQGDGTITDDDAPPGVPTATIADASSQEGEPFPGNPKSLSFPVTLSAPASQTIRVTLTPTQITPLGQAVATVGPGATCGGSMDVPGTIRVVDIPPGQTTGVITVQLCPDNVSENEEKFLARVATYVMTSGGPQSPGSGITDEAFGTIVNDDGLETFISIADKTVTETDANFNVNMVITLSRALTTAANVNLYKQAPQTGQAAISLSPSVCGVTPAPGLTGVRRDDFEGPPSTISIPANVTSVNVLFLICGDNDWEPTESVVIRIQPPLEIPFANPDDLYATLRIQNDDAATVGRPSSR